MLFRSDRRYDDDESYGEHGYTEQEFVDGELEDVDMEPDDSEFDDDAEMEFDEYYDDDME